MFGGRRGGKKGGGGVREGAAKHERVLENGDGSVQGLRARSFKRA
jgi:hypothetical protein